MVEQIDQNHTEEGQVEKNYPGEWYVVHTYSGYENKIKVDLAKRVESMGMQDKIFEILIPEEQEIEYKAVSARLVISESFRGMLSLT